MDGRGFPRARHACTSTDSTHHTHTRTHTHTHNTPTRHTSVQHCSTPFVKCTDRTYRGSSGRRGNYTRHTSDETNLRCKAHTLDPHAEWQRAKTQTPCFVPLGDMAGSVELRTVATVSMPGRTNRGWVAACASSSWPAFSFLATRSLLWRHLHPRPQLYSNQHLHLYQHLHLHLRLHPHLRRQYQSWCFGQAGTR